MALSIPVKGGRIEGFVVASPSLTVGRGWKLISLRRVSPRIWRVQRRFPTQLPKSIVVGARQGPHPQPCERRLPSGVLLGILPSLSRRFPCSATLKDGWWSLFEAERLRNEILSLGGTQMLTSRITSFH